MFEIDFVPSFTGTPTSLSATNHSMEMLAKDCSNLNHELVPITPLAEAIPMNSPMDGLLPPLSHFHLLHQQTQHSQLVPIQIQQTQPAIMSSSGATMAPCSTTTTTVVSIGEPSSSSSMGVGDEPPSHIIPMMMVADPSNNGGGSCLTCLPELPETEDYEEEEDVEAHGHEETDCNGVVGDQHQQNHHHRSVMCDGAMTAN